MNKKDLIPGEIYVFSYNSSKDYINKIKDNDCNIIAYIDIDRLTYHEGGTYSTANSFRAATTEEKQWLEACIKVNDFVSKDKALYPFYVRCTYSDNINMFKVGKIYKTEPVFTENHISIRCDSKNILHEIPLEGSVWRFEACDEPITKRDDKIISDYIENAPFKVGQKVKLKGTGSCVSFVGLPYGAQIGDIVVVTEKAYEGNIPEGSITKITRIDDSDIPYEVEWDEITSWCKNVRKATYLESHDYLTSKFPLTATNDMTQSKFKIGGNVKWKDGSEVFKLLSINDNGFTIEYQGKPFNYRHKIEELCIPTDEPTIDSYPLEVKTDSFHSAGTGKTKTIISDIIEVKKLKTFNK